MSLTTLAPLSGLLLLFTLAATLAPAFYSSANLSNVARQAAILGIIAIGQTFVLLVAGIDLSVGAVMGAAMIVAAQATGGRDEAIPAALVIAAGIGLLIGLANAFLVVARRVPPLVATLAMLILIEGARLAWTQGVPSGSLPAGLRVLGIGRLAGIPVPVITLVVVALVAAFVLRRTTFGRAVYAAGANPTAALLAGVRVPAVVTAAYVICSLLAILGGLMLSGYIGYVDRYLGQGFDLDSIAAAVVGGTALTGGKGSVGGTLVGVAFVAMLLNLIVLLNAGIATQLVVKGSVIVLAVALQQRTREETA
ncbi:MAG: ABC transporter permease [Egibacteraceae bacterium]